jgi:hypothetical protein
MRIPFERQLCCTNAIKERQDDRDRRQLPHNGVQEVPEPQKHIHFVNNY